MDAGIRAQLGMKGGYQVAALLDPNRIALINSPHAGVRTDVADNRRANDDGLEIAGVRPLREIRLGRKLSHAAIDLAAVPVALDRQIHEPETLLGRVRDIRRQENCAGAGSEDGPSAAKLDKRLDHAFSVQQLEHGRALATGNDEAVQIFKVGSGAGKHRLGAGAGQSAAVRFEIALQCQHPDLLHYQPRVCISSDSCSFETSMPCMPIPSSSLASSSFSGSLK